MFSRLLNNNYFIYLTRNNIVETYNFNELDNYKLDKLSDHFINRQKIGLNKTLMIIFTNIIIMFIIFQK